MPVVITTRVSTKIGAKHAQKTHCPLYSDDSLLGWLYSEMVDHSQIEALRAWTADNNTILGIFINNPNKMSVSDGHLTAAEELNLSVCYLQRRH
jgi:hypothetical protein